MRRLFKPANSSLIRWGRALRDGIEISLNHREFEVLEYLAPQERPGSRDAAEVEGFGYATNVIEVYINLCEKVEVAGRSPRIITLRGGLMSSGVRLNIRWRLTLWNTLALAVVLTSFAALVYGLLRHALLEQTDRVLQSGRAQLQGDARIETATEQRLRYLIDEFREHQSLLCVVNRADGTPYARTPELAEKSVPLPPIGDQVRWEYNENLPIIGRQRVLAQRMRLGGQDFMVMLSLLLKP